MKSQNHLPTKERRHTVAWPWLTLAAIPCAMLGLNILSPSTVGTSLPASSARGTASKGGDAISTTDDSGMPPPKKESTRGTTSNAKDDLALITTAPWSDGARMAVCRLATGGPETVSVLASALTAAHDQESARLLAMTLARQGTGDAVEAIWRTALEKRDPKLREAILDAFDNLTNEEGVTLLASALAATSDPDIVNAANRTVARAATADTVAFLADLYAEEPRIPGQREQVLQAVQMITIPSATPALGVLARSTDSPELASAAAASLAKTGDAAALHALREAHGALTGNDLTSSTLRAQLLAAFAMVQVTEETAPTIAEFAARETSAEWQAAAQSLVEQGPRRKKLCQDR